MDRKKNNNKGQDPVITPTVLFEETFENIIDITDILKTPEVLDNPESFKPELVNKSAVYAGREPGALSLDDGDANSAGSNSLRIAFTVPGLKDAVSPRLKLSIRNESENLIKLYIGNLFADSGKLGEDGHRAYYVLEVPANTGYQEYVIELGTKYTHTNLIQLRPTVWNGSKDTETGAAGLYVDWIQVVDVRYYERSGSRVTILRGRDRRQAPGRNSMNRLRNWQPPWSLWVGCRTDFDARNGNDGRSRW